jgi:hypothetical protein
MVREIFRITRRAARRSEGVGFEVFCRRIVAAGRVGAWATAATKPVQLAREQAVVRHVAARAWRGRRLAGRWANELALKIRGVFADVWTKVRLLPVTSEGDDPADLTGAADVCRTLALAALYGLGRGALGPPLVGRRVPVAWAPSFVGLGRVLRRALAGQVDDDFMSHAFYDSVLASALVEAGLARRIRAYGGRCPVCTRVDYFRGAGETCPQCRSPLEAHRLALVLGTEFSSRIARVRRNRRAVLVPERPWPAEADETPPPAPGGGMDAVAAALTTIVAKDPAGGRDSAPEAMLLVAARTRRGTRLPFTSDEAAETLGALLHPTAAKGRLLRKYRTQRRRLTGLDEEVRPEELSVAIARLRARLAGALARRAWRDAESSA